MSIVAEAGFGPVAQRLEQWTHNPLVQGSNPCGPTKNSFLLRLSSFVFEAAQNIPSSPPVA
jgi:hypothetical protein